MDIEEMKKARLSQMQGRSEGIERSMSNIKYKVGIYSGKGGVGKTTIATGLALALAGQGKKVGLLDADIDCPNAHVLLGVSGRASMEGGRIVPLEKSGVRIVSMAFLMQDDDAVMWRGPMVSKAVGDLLSRTDWGDIDYLIMDLPPGTSDVPITVMQLLPKMTGFFAVTTPQALSAPDLKRALSMMDKMNIPVLGIIENMCSQAFGCSEDKSRIAHFPLTPEGAAAEASAYDAIIRKIEST
jgi:ATP-binding protein involved in chromosome partitioning